MTESEELELLQLERERNQSLTKPLPLQKEAKTTAGFASRYVTDEPNIPTKTMAETATSLTNFVSPSSFMPTMDNPIPNIPQAFEEKRKFLESAGTKTKQAVTGSFGNAVSKTSELANKYLPKPLAKAVEVLAIGGGTLGATATELQPNRPSDLAMQAVGYMAPLALSESTSGIQKEIANRNLQAKPALQQSRYVKGKKTVGEVAFETPKDVADLAVSNKDVMYKNADTAIKVLGNKIKSRINDVFENTSNISANTSVPIKQNLAAGEIPPKMGVNTKEIADAMNPVIDDIARSEGVNSRAYKDLIKFKERFIARNGEFMNWARSNSERMTLGEDISKGFLQSPDVISPKTEAMRNMWAALRSKIGGMDKTLDEMLTLQHDLMDVRSAALPEAAKGVTKTPSEIVEVVKSPFRNISVANFLGKTLPRQGVKAGAVAATVASQSRSMEPLSKEIERMAR